jgi:hypothetical protein
MGSTIGMWQGIHIAEHRGRPHQCEVVLQFIGSRWAINLLLLSSSFL